MRLLSLELNGFRGFPQRQHIDLDADAIVFIGANGNGKTSLFDGILWALTGRVPRLSRDDTRLVSMYSGTGQVRVELQLRDSSTNERYTVTRSFDGQESRVTFKAGEEWSEGPVAIANLIKLIWPDAASAPEPEKALATVFTRSVYLQQDVIRHFVEAASEDERFEAVSELVGIGRVAELQGSLEREKKAWSTATNKQREELRPSRERLAQIDARLSELTRRAPEASPLITSEAWDEWWRILLELGLNAVQVEPASREAPQAIDNAINKLSTLRRSTERKLKELYVLRDELTVLNAKSLPMMPPLIEAEIKVKAEVAQLKRLIADEQERLAKIRNQQATLQEKTEQLKALAVLALENLGDLCPVCRQTYDRETTMMRLENLANEVFNTQTGVEPEKLSSLLTALEAKEKELSAGEVARRSAELVIEEYNRARLTLSARLVELGITIGQNNNPLAKPIEDAEGLIRRVSELERTGESLALGLAQSSSIAAIVELRREAETLRKENDDAERLLAARNKTGELAQRVIEGLREASLAEVEKRLSEITPLLQSIYARIDPHPAFRVVRFMSRIFNKKGLLSTVVNDPIANLESEVPAVVLSSSQINALAVSVFLALNIGVPNLPLSAAMLDDPLQSLDDINLLGLVDLLRRTKDQRQLLVSTHDSRFGDLLSRKLRPGDDNGRTVVIELEGWTREGPSVRSREVKCDPEPLRLVAS